MSTTLKYLLTGEDKSASSTLKHVGEEAGRTHGAFGKLASIAGGVFGGELLAEGAAKVGEFLKDSVTEAAAAQGQLAILSKTMSNVGISGEGAGEKAEKFLTTLSESSGTVKGELIPAYTSLIRATGNTASAHKLLDTAMNVSAGTGKSLGSISLALAKAQNGNVEGLSRLGIATKDAAGKTLTFAQVQGELAQKFGGDWKAKAGTAGGEYARLGVTFDNLKEKVGTALLPILTQFGGWLVDKGIPAAEKLGDKIGTVLGPVFQQLGAFIQSALPSIESFATSLGQKLGPLVDKIGHAIGVVLKGYIDGARAAFDQVRAAVEKNKPELEKLGTAIAKIVGWLADHLAPILGFLYKTQIKLFGAAITTAIGIVSGFVDAISGIISTGKKVVSWFEALPGKITGAFGDAETLLSDIGSKIIDGLLAPLRAGVDKVKGVLQGITKMIPKWKGPADVDAKLLTPAGESIMQSLVDGILNGQGPLASALGKVTQQVKNAATKLSTDMQAQSQFAQSFGGFAQTLFGGNADGSAPTISDILGGGANLAAQAQQYAADMAAAIKNGLSKTSLMDIQSQGAAGAGALHALAGASAGQVAQVNAYEAQQAAAYGAAGTAAGNAVYGSQIAKDFGTLTVDLKQDGKSIQKLLLKLKRDNGGLSLGLA